MSNKAFDVVSMGELLIDYTQCGISEAGMNIYEENPGGAPGNLAVAISKLGRSVAFIGKVGDDAQGELLVDTLAKQGVEIRGIIKDKNVYTTLAFVQINAEGERKFSFSRKPGADTQITKEEINLELLKTTRVFHCGSLSLTNEPSRSALWEAIRIAKDEGAIISYDPNYRNLLWKSKDMAIEQMRSIIGMVDIIKISDEEMELLTGQGTPESAAFHLIEKGIQVVVVTLGKKGAYVCTKQGGRYVTGFAAKQIDTTGAGDSFWGGFIYGIVSNNKKLHEISLDEYTEYVKFGNALASLCVERRGGIPAMPTLEEVRKRLKS